MSHKVSDSLLPHAPTIRAHVIYAPPINIYLFGERFGTSIKAKIRYMVFNIFIEAGWFRELIPGLRVASGQIHPPQAKIFKKAFNHWHLGKEARGVIYTLVKSVLPSDITLDSDVEQATAELYLGKDTFTEYAKRTEDVI